MYIIDPDTGLPVEAAPDPASAAAAAPEPAAPAAPAAPEPTEAEAALAAMDEGLATLAPEPAAPAEPATPEEPAVPGAELTQEQKDAAALEAAKPDAAVETEITSLGLKEKAAARFRELTNEVKTLAPIKAQLEAAGIKDIAEIPVLVKQAKDGSDLVEMVTATGATAEQFGMQLDYMTLLQKVNTGDVGAAEKALAMAMGEVEALSKLLGKEIPGVHDPLATHADLLADIESGDITRKRALEIAATRAQGTVTAAARQQQEQQNTQQQAQEQAIATGKAELTAFDQATAAADPHYAAKRPILNAKVAEIRKQYPPHLWAATTKLAYEAIPNPAPAAVIPPKPPIGPVRPNGPRPVLAPTTFDDPLAALDAGIAAASG